MGQSESKIIVLVCNMSNDSYWVRINLDLWERIDAGNSAYLNCREYSELTIYDEERKSLVSRIDVKSTDTVLRIKDDKKNHKKNQKKIQVFEAPLSEDMKRPFYLIAHGVNRAQDISSMVSLGANGCELDVYYSNKKWYVGHDPDSKGDDAKETVTEWFNECRKTSLAVVIVDTKTPCPGWQMKELLADIRRTKYRHPVIFSVATELKCLLNIERELRANEGLATDYLNVPGSVMKQISADANFWYGNGIASMLPKPGLYNTIRSAVMVRNMGAKIKKVYAWTFNSATSFREYLLLDVDGMIVETEFLREAREILKEYPFYRVADIKDDVFQKF